MKLYSGLFHKSAVEFIALLGVVAGLVVAQAAPARAQALQLLYWWTGVTDNGGVDNTGVATSFTCANFSGAAQTIQIVAFSSGGGLVANHSASLPHLNTITFSTHPTIIFQDAGSISNLATGFIGQGQAGVSATSIYTLCTAMVVDAAAPAAAGASSVAAVSLHGVRFNPMPGTVE